MLTELALNGYAQPVISILGIEASWEKGPATSPHWRQQVSLST
jgi:hypothetical protein